MREPHVPGFYQFRQKYKKKAEQPNETKERGESESEIVLEDKDVFKKNKTEGIVRN